jgi:4,5-dihydroxyphthalate decarboxylase
VQPKPDWEKSAVGAHEYYELIPSDWTQVRAWNERTSIYPFHGVLVVKSAVIERAPWVAQTLYRALCESKDIFLRRVSEDPHHEPSGRHYSQLKDIVGPDPLPYGIEANRLSIEALIEFCREQKLIRSQWSARDVFLEVHRLKGSS